MRLGEKLSALRKQRGTDGIGRKAERFQAGCVQVGTGRIRVLSETPRPYFSTPFQALKLCVHLMFLKNPTFHPVEQLKISSNIFSILYKIA